MNDIAVTPQTIIISHPFSELLLGGHVTRVQQAGVISPAMPNAGGPVCARRTRLELSFMQSPR
jgi:hypothetical protein